MHLPLPPSSTLLCQHIDPSMVCNNTKLDHRTKEDYAITARLITLFPQAARPSHDNPLPAAVSITYLTRRGAIDAQSLNL